MMSYREHELRLSRQIVVTCLIKKGAEELGIKELDNMDKDEMNRAMGLHILKKIASSHEIENEGLSEVDLEEKIKDHIQKKGLLCPELEYIVCISRKITEEFGIKGYDTMILVDLYKAIETHVSKKLGEDRRIEGMDGMTLPELNKALMNSLKL